MFASVAAWKDDDLSEVLGDVTERSVLWGSQFFLWFMGSDLLRSPGFGKPVLFFLVFIAFLKKKKKVSVQCFVDFKLCFFLLSLSLDSQQVSVKDFLPAVLCLSPSLSFFSHLLNYCLIIHLLPVLFLCFCSPLSPFVFIPVAIVLKFSF